MASGLLESTVASLIADKAKSAIENPGQVLGPIQGLLKMAAENAARNREFRMQRRAERRGVRAQRRAQRSARQTQSTRRRVRAPTSVATVSKTSAPSVGRALSRPLPVSHQEFIFSVTSSQAWNTWTFPIQPGDAITMPWASHMTNLYERYKIKSMTFEYEPNCASTTIGSIVLCPAYDAVDAAPTSFEEATSKLGAVHGQAWTPMSCHLDPSRIHSQMPMLTTRKATVAGTDIKTYDGGNFHLCVTDCADDGTLIGRLSVRYTLELATPVGATESILDYINACSSGLTPTNLLDDCSEDGGGYGSLSFSYEGGKNYWQVPGEYAVLLRVSGSDLASPFSSSSCGGTWNTVQSYVDAAATGAFFLHVGRVEAGDIYDPTMDNSVTITACTIHVWQARYSDYDAF